MAKARAQKAPKAKRRVADSAGAAGLPNRRTFTETVVTVAMATLWMSPEINVNNRRLRRGKVALFAQKMRQGKWYLTHQAIAFDCDGKLIDGQHRLAAVMLSECVTRFYVARNVPREVLPGIDVEGTVRNPPDVARYEGWELSNKSVGVAKRMISGISPNYIIATVQEVLDFIRDHDEAVEFGVRMMKPNKAGITQAPMGAVFARALYQAEAGDLERAAYLLREGMPPDSRCLLGDKSMLVLRAALTSNGSETGQRGRVEMYCKVERALRAFLDRKDLTKIYMARQEYFLLPEEGAGGGLLVSSA